MLTAKSIMKSDVVSIHRDTSVYEATKILIEKQFTGLPVVNDDMTLAGIVSEKDILRFVSDLHLLDLICDLEHSGATAEDIMTTRVVSFDEDDDLTTVCRSLIDNNFRRVPILSGGKLTGIISRKDIIGHIMETADAEVMAENWPIDQLESV